MYNTVHSSNDGSWNSSAPMRNMPSHSNERNEAEYRKKHRNRNQAPVNHPNHQYQSNYHNNRPNNNHNPWHYRQQSSSSWRPNRQSGQPDSYSKHKNGIGTNRPHESGHSSSRSRSSYAASHKHSSDRRNDRSRQQYSRDNASSYGNGSHSYHDRESREPRDHRDYKDYGGRREPSEPGEPRDAKRPKIDRQQEHTAYNEFGAQQIGPLGMMDPVHRWHGSPPPPPPQSSSLSATSSSISPYNHYAMHAHPQTAMNGGYGDMYMSDARLRNTSVPDVPPPSLPPPPPPSLPPNIRRSDTLKATMPSYSTPPPTQQTHKDMHPYYGGPRDFADGLPFLASNAEQFTKEVDDGAEQISSESDDYTEYNASRTTSQARQKKMSSEHSRMGSAFSNGSSTCNYEDRNRQETMVMTNSDAGYGTSRTEPVVYENVIPSNDIIDMTSMALGSGAGHSPNASHASQLYQGCPDPNVVGHGENLGATFTGQAAAYEYAPDSVEHENGRRVAKEASTNQLISHDASAHQSRWHGNETTESLCVEKSTNDMESVENGVLFVRDIANYASTSQIDVDLTDEVASEETDETLIKEAIADDTCTQHNDDIDNEVESRGNGSIFVSEMENDQSKLNMERPHEVESFQGDSTINAMEDGYESSHHVSDEEPNDIESENGSIFYREIGIVDTSSRVETGSSNDAELLQCDSAIITIASDDDSSQEHGDEATTSVHLMDNGEIIARENEKSKPVIETNPPNSADDSTIITIASDDDSNQQHGDEAATIDEDYGEIFARDIENESMSPPIDVESTSDVITISDGQSANDAVVMPNGSIFGLDIDKEPTPDVALVQNDSATVRTVSADEQPSLDSDVEPASDVELVQTATMLDGENSNDAPSTCGSIESTNQEQPMHVDSVIAQVVSDDETIQDPDDESPRIGPTIDTTAVNDKSTTQPSSGSRSSENDVQSISDDSVDMNIISYIEPNEHPNGHSADESESLQNGTMVGEGVNVDKPAPHIGGEAADEVQLMNDGSTIMTKVSEGDPSHCLTEQSMDEDDSVPNASISDHIIIDDKSNPNPCSEPAHEARPKENESAVLSDISDDEASQQPGDGSMIEVESIHGTDSSSHAESDMYESSLSHPLPDNESSNPTEPIEVDNVEEVEDPRPDSQSNDPSLIEMQNADESNDADESDVADESNVDMNEESYSNIDSDLEVDRDDINDVSRDELMIISDLQRRSQVAQRNLPCPFEIVSRVNRPAANDFERAEQMIDAEMESMLHYDTIMSGSKRTSPDTLNRSLQHMDTIAENGSPYEDIDDDALQHARKMLADEMNVVKNGIGHGHITFDRYAEVRESCMKSVLYKPRQNTYVQRGSLQGTRSDQIEEAEFIFKQNRDHLDKERLRYDDRLKRYKELCGGYEERQKLLSRTLYRVVGKTDAEEERSRFGRIEGKRFEEFADRMQSIRARAAALGVSLGELFLE